jgi:ubiquinone/menaquinone biosynthesis C-methylase UbiE
MKGAGEGIPRDKYQLVRHLLRDGVRSDQPATLLDVGCRACELRPHVDDFAAYTGVDLVQNDAGTVDHVLNVEHGLPFADRSFDYVVAMDLLEHLDRFHEGAAELARVTRGKLLVVLPNLSHLFARVRFLLHGRFGTDKYDLPLTPIDDRHRWVTVLPQTDAYMRAFAAAEGMTLQVRHVNDSRSRALFARVAGALRLPAALWAWKAVYVLERPGSRA